MTDSPPKDDRTPLVKHLYKLGAGGSPDRQALARLRRAATGDPAAVIGAYPHVVPFVGKGSIDDAVLLASLFASHPDGGGDPLGAALRKVMDRRKSESIELRFLALLQASRGDLDHHLRQAVALCRSESAAIDWQDLEFVIRGWELPERRQQKKLARDFWRSPQAPAPTVPPPQPAS